MPQDPKQNFKSLEKIVLGFIRPLEEIYFGCRYQYLPYVEVLTASNIIAVLLILKADIWIFSFFNLRSLYPSLELRYWIYFFGLVLLPFFLWGTFQALKTLKMARELERAFKVAGLINSLQKMPSLLSNVPIDAATKKLKITSAYMPLKKFEDARPTLESALHVYIEKMKANINRGTVEIIYSPYPMPEMITYEFEKTKSQSDFWIGNTRAGRKMGDFSDTPHLLIAGQTGGGKSTFVRQLLSGLYLKDRTAQFILIDLKGGLEASLFEELQRVVIVHELPPSVLELAKLEKIIRQRMTHYKSEHCKDLEEFKKKVQTEELAQKDFDRKLMLSRYYIVIDEAAEMFLAGGGRSSESVEVARRVVSLIARQGRSVGIHLVIATQRPDSKALDPQVKANLTGVLCFPIANDASSITVLGNGRATDLPDIKGRAIWKNGMELVEVQTPYLSPEDFKKLVKDEKKHDQPPRPQNPPRSLEVEASTDQGSVDPTWSENHNRQSLRKAQAPGKTKAHSEFHS